MQLRNTPDRWGAVQQTLHWTIAPLAIFQYGLGVYIGDLPAESLEEGGAFGLHATLGLLILILTVARFLWRLANPVPRMPERLRHRWERALVRVTHHGFYVLLVVQPLTGYLMVGAMDHAVPFFGWTLPPIVGASESLASGLFYAHMIGAALLFAALALHVAGALRHEFLLQDNTFRRMTPLAPRGHDYRARTTRRSPESESVRATTQTGRR